MTENMRLQKTSTNIVGNLIRCRVEVWAILRVVCGSSSCRGLVWTRFSWPSTHFSTSKFQLAEHTFFHIFVFRLIKTLSQVYNWCEEIIQPFGIYSGHLSIYKIVKISLLQLLMLCLQYLLLLLTDTKIPTDLSTRLFIFRICHHDIVMGYLIIMRQLF